MDSDEKIIFDAVLGFLLLCGEFERAEAGESPP